MVVGRDGGERRGILGVLDGFAPLGVEDDNGAWVGRVGGWVVGSAAGWMDGWGFKGCVSTSPAQRFTRTRGEQAACGTTCWDGAPCARHARPPSSQPPTARPPPHPSPSPPRFRHSGAQGPAAHDRVQEVEARHGWHAGHSGGSGGRQGAGAGMRRPARRRSVPLPLIATMSTRLLLFAPSALPRVDSTARAQHKRASS